MSPMRAVIASGNAAIWILAAIVLLAGCDKGENKQARQEPAVGKSRLDEIIERLRSDDADARNRAVARLKRIASKGLTQEEDSQALRAAAEAWPADKDIDPSGELVEAALGRPRQGHAQLICEYFPRFSEMARWRSTRYLVETCDEAAARAYLGLVERHADLVPPVGIDGFTQSPEITRWLIPSLLKHAARNELGYQVHSLSLRAAQLELVTESDLAPFAGSVVQMCNPLLSRMRTMEKPVGDDWIWSDDYCDDRAHATLLLDLMGYLPREATVATLVEAQKSRDPRVRHFAALSLIRHGQDVSADMFESVAASPEVRNLLYVGLASLKRLDLFPSRFASQQAFAEADMVNWLTYPTELGRTPHEIELMATFDGDSGQQRYYLFRFRTHAPHWAAEDGWMAGLSGPFDVASMPTTEGGDSTFSDFTKWDEKTPKDHFEAISGLIAEYWKKQAADMTQKEK